MKNFERVKILYSQKLLGMSGMPERGQKGITHNLRRVKTSIIQRYSRRIVVKQIAQPPDIGILSRFSMCRTRAGGVDLTVTM